MTIERILSSPGLYLGIAHFDVMEIIRITHYSPYFEIGKHVAVSTFAECLAVGLGA